MLVPFDVPDSQQWTVTGLFTNDLSDINVLDPPKAFWSIRKDVRKGDCGSVIASGNTGATFKPTGRSGNGFEEYTTLTNIKRVILPPGRYWLTTVPECTNTRDSKCEANARYFASSFTGKGKHAYGPKEPCAAFFNSPFFGSNCQPASRFATSAPNFPRACWGQNRLERKLLGAEPDLQQMPARLFLLRIHEIGEVNAAIA